MSNYSLGRMKISAALVAVGLSMFVGAAVSQTQEESVYGGQLMTERERNEYRDRIRSAKTHEERDGIRSTHREAMKARAKARGVTLPDEPPPQGIGYGRGGPTDKGPMGGPKGQGGNR